MEKAMEILKNRTLEELVSDFETTTDNNEPSIFEVREWLMKEIERRNPKGYDEWLDDFREDNELRNFVL